MALLMIFILWTWGLTPEWVNIAGTLLMLLRMACNFLKFTFND